MQADSYENLWAWLADDAREELTALAADDDAAPSSELVHDLSHAVAHLRARGDTVSVITFPPWSGGAEDSRSARVDPHLLAWIRRSGFATPTT